MVGIKGRREALLFLGNHIHSTTPKAYYEYGFSSGQEGCFPRGWPSFCSPILEFCDSDQNRFADLILAL